MSVPVEVARVSLVGGTPLVRAGMRQMLLSCPDLILVPANLAHPAEVDLVLVDVDDSVSSGLGTAAVVVGPLVRDGARVVAISWCTNPLLVEELLDLGAVGFLSKSIALADLARAMVDLRAGSVVISV